MWEGCQEPCGWLMLLLPRTRIIRWGIFVRWRFFFVGAMWLLWVWVFLQHASWISDSRKSFGKVLHLADLSLEYGILDVVRVVEGPSVYDEGSSAGFRDSSSGWLCFFISQRTFIKGDTRVFPTQGLRRKHWAWCMTLWELF